MLNILQTVPQLPGCLNVAGVFSIDVALPSVIQRHGFFPRAHKAPPSSFAEQRLWQMLILYLIPRVVWISIFGGS